MDRQDIEQKLTIARSLHEMAAALLAGRVAALAGGSVLMFLSRSFLVPVFWRSSLLFGSRFCSAWFALSVPAYCPLPLALAAWRHLWPYSPLWVGLSAVGLAARELARLRAVGEGR